MKLRYYIFDEIKLEVCKDVFTNKIFFEDFKTAQKKAPKYAQSWQIVEIPFYEEGEAKQNTLNQIGDKCFADTCSIKVVDNLQIILIAEVDGEMFDSSDHYENDPVKWLQGIINRVYDCAMGKLN